MLVQAIQGVSQRTGAFVAVNYGAIRRDLVESERFGHRKGALSGALQDQPALIRTSHGGVLFRDEIGDLPLSAQATLLRVLQESEVMPDGSARPVPVNLRAIAATHRDLDRLVVEQDLRRDLLARLDGVAIELPPLRQRCEDVPLLIAKLLTKLAPKRPGLAFSPDTALLLIEHGWPLNVRELDQALEQALALSPSGTIERDHLPRALRAAVPDPARERNSGELCQCDELLALSQHRGNLAPIARAVGKGRTQWILRYGLDPEKYRRG